MTNIIYRLQGEKEAVVQISKVIQISQPALKVVGFIKGWGCFSHFVEMIRWKGPWVHWCNSLLNRSVSQDKTCKILKSAILSRLSPTELSVLSSWKEVNNNDVATLQFGVFPKDPQLRQQRFSEVKKKGKTRKKWPYRVQKHHKLFLWVLSCWSQWQRGSCSKRLHRWSQILEIQQRSEEAN